MGKPLNVGEWTEVKLSSIIRTLASGASVNAEARPAIGAEAGVLKVSSVSNGRFFPEENKAVTGPDLAKVKMPVAKGDLLISRANTLDLIGACGCVDGDYPNLYLPDKLWKAILRSPSEDCTEWLMHVLNSPPMRRALKDRATGTSGSMKNIPQESFLAITILRPPLSEQRKIAAILTTWDRAIELTEKRIAAKRQRKAALMQRLLTGRVRLLGFEKGHWTKCLLGEVASNSSRRNGTAKSPVVYSVTNSVGMVPMEESVIGESIERYKTVAQYDFAYNPMRINVGSIAMWDGDDEVLVSPDYVVFQCGPDLDAEFLNHFRRTHYWHQFVNRSGGGSVRVRIYFSDLAELPLNLPPLPEQKAIAAVLNTQDREIELLRQKLDALRRQKKGLMQQLLTGKVRVNVTEPSGA